MGAAKAEHGFETYLCTDDKRKKRRKKGKHEKRWIFKPKRGNGPTEETEPSRGTVITIWNRVARLGFYILYTRSYKHAFFGGGASQGHRDLW